MVSNKQIIVKHLFKPLDDQLMLLLESLSADDWDKSTVAKQWTVKDVVSHLLDGNIRALSIQRDKYFGEPTPGFGNYVDLVNWLNQLNADWVKASKRISPGMLILLHKATNVQTTAYYESLDPNDDAIFPVSWAGEERSLNWMHIAREYTEKWHHQQQIQEATNRQGIFTREFFYPMISTFLLALPHTFKNIVAPLNTLITVNITGDVGGFWYLQKQTNGWQLTEHVSKNNPCTLINLPQTIAWKLFSKSVRPSQIISDVEIIGDRALAIQVLNMVSVMA